MIRNVNAELFYLLAEKIIIASYTEFVGAFVYRRYTETLVQMLADVCASSSEY